MKTIQQNWKQSLAAFAFLAAINGQDAVGREAQSQPAAPAPAASAASAAPTPAAVPRLANADPQDVQQILQDLFQRSGSIRANNNNNRNSILGTGNPLTQRATANQQNNSSGSAFGGGGSRGGSMGGGMGGGMSF